MRYDGSKRYDGYQRSHASMVYTFFDKQSSGGDIKNKIIPNRELAEELHKPIIRKRIVYPSFKDIICGSDLTDMQLISESIKGFRFLLCVIDIYSKYAWVGLL